jgi:peroxiredoxin/mono/diheme cytochrome c family protein
MRILVLLGMLMGAVPAAEAFAVPAADAAKDFALPDTQGKLVSLGDFKDKKIVVVLFLGNECPLVQTYMPRLMDMAASLEKQGVQFVGINSNSQDDAASLAAYAAKYNLNFPLLKDDHNRVADRFGAERTPEVFVLDAKRQVVYQGRIDDQYGVGYQRPYANRHDLKIAIDELLNDQPVTLQRTKSAGCLIGRVKTKTSAAPTVTYTKHVAAILQNHCVDCHRPGQIGPFALTSYEKAKSWADMIAEVVTDRRMPPWHADPRFGSFSNDRSLPENDKKTLLAWIEQGCAKGDDADLPPLKTFPQDDGWTIGKPDIVLTMKDEFHIPAENPKGGFPYQFVTIPTNFKEDVWIQAVEARPGNKAVVHHILAFVHSGDKPFNPRGEDSIGNNLLVGTAPGDMPGIYPPGVGKRIPKGSVLLLQMHYTPNGTPQKDRSSIGMILCKEPPRFEAHTRAMLTKRFAIPPGASNHEVRTRSVFREEAILFSLMPHLHVRGKSFMYKAHYPNGKEEILLHVPNYDFGWQVMYRLKKPLTLPAGTVIESIATYDNSAENPNNPDPTKTVYWGDMTWEEMMIGWADYYYPRRTLKVSQLDR